MKTCHHKNEDVLPAFDVLHVSKAVTSLLTIPRAVWSQCRDFVGGCVAWVGVFFSRYTDLAGGRGHV